MLARVSFRGWVERRAIFRPGLGTTLTLVLDHTETELRPQVSNSWRPQCPDLSAQPWPVGNASQSAPMPAGVDTNRLKQILEEAFLEPDSLSFWRGTHAVVVLYQGQIVAEHYGRGIHQDMPLLGWSMTKTVVNALVGILVASGKVAIHAPAPVPEWQAPGDPHAKNSPWINYCG